MAVEGPCLDNEFAEFLKGPGVSLNLNHFTYKKAVNNNVNFLRVVLVKRYNFKEKRVIVNVNDSGVDRCIQNTDTMLPRIQINERDDDLDDDEQKKDEHKSFGSNPSQSSRGSVSHKDAKYGKNDQKKRKDKLRIYFKDGIFNLLNKEFIENYSTVELERVISLMNAKDAFIMMRKAELAERLREMNERHAREKADREANEMKYANKIEMFEQRSGELKAKELTRVSPNDVFLYIMTLKLSRKKVLSQISTSHRSRNIEKYVEKSKMACREVPRDIDKSICMLITGDIDKSKIPCRELEISTSQNLMKRTRDIKKLKAHLRNRRYR
ncbi:hypothetical protein AgCh_018466 [Apium graveolens]